MHAKIREAVDGRTLVAVEWRRETPDGLPPDLEAVFEIFWPTEFSLTSNPMVVNLLSVTRVDTREADGLMASEKSEVFNAIAIAAAKFDASLLEAT